MEDEYNYTCTAPLDDTIVLDSPVAESRLLNLNMDTEVLDVCESARHSGDQMEGYGEKEVVLDSDDEGGDENQVNMVNVEHRPVIGRFSGWGTIGLLERKKVRAGYFRRLNKKFGEHVLLHLDSAKSDRADGESNAGRTCLYNDGRFQEHLVAMDRLLSSSPDQKPAPMNVNEDSEYQNMGRENLTEDSSDERKLSSQESKSKELEKDANFYCERAELNSVESPDPGESQGKALEFVDQYLSVSNLGLYKDIQNRNMKRIVSPPSLRSKGSQCLARRVNLGCTASKSVTFDWSEKPMEKGEYTSLRKNSTFGFKGDKSGYLSFNQVSNSTDLQKEISSLQLKEKLPGNTQSNKDLDTNSLDSGDIDKVSGTCIAHDSMELDKQFIGGLTRQDVEKGEEVQLTPDALDIGPDTQIAAEAIEALIQAAPPMFDTGFAQQDSDNTLLGSSNTVNKKNELKHLANDEEPFVRWRCKGKRSKCVKISSVQGKNLSCSAGKPFENQRGAVTQLPGSKNLVTMTQMTRKDIHSRHLGDKMKSKSGGLPGIAVQQEKYKFSGRDSLEEFQKIHELYGRRAEESNHGIKFGSPQKRRKMISFHDDAHPKGVTGTSLKLSSDSSSKVKTETSEKLNLDLADGTLAKLDAWIYPKGKRSRQLAVRHLITSGNQCFPCAETENNVEKYPIVNEEAPNRGCQLVVYARRRKFSIERKQIGSSFRKAGDLSSPSVNDDVISDRQVQVSIELDTAKPSVQCGKLDDGKPSSADVTGNMNSDVLPNGHSITLQELESSGKSKQTSNLVSRSPLMKELVRLGYKESLPDFLPKDSRRRRAMEKVCILFSQNLEASILKQQRKIVARLGFSIASCCSNATHFVTDRFVRTRNMLEAIALGKPVVTHLWLESCGQAGYVIDEKSYILRDEKKEKEIGFNMHVSLTRASQHPLLKGHRVLITPNVKPGMDMINGLVKAVQGQAVQSVLITKTKDKGIPDDLLILSSEEDYTICLPFLEKGASVHSSELLLNGIVTQKLEYERYQLFKDFTKNDSSSLPPKRRGNMACATHT